MEEQRLWSAVVLQAFVDATAPLPEQPKNYDAWIARRREKFSGESEVAERAVWLGKTSSHRTAVAVTKTRAHRARNWLLHDCRDFPWVCGAAGRDPHLVRDSARRLKAAGWPETKVEV